MSERSRSFVDYIFCISTGRSGTHYLSKLFDTASECISFHENDPIGNGKEMQSFLHGRKESMHALTEEKAKRIAGFTDNKKAVYVETNHCFIKGFGWLLPDFLPEERIGIVILTRDREKVAQSLLRTSSTPLTAVGRKWMTLPSVKSPLVKPPCLPPLGPKATFLLFRGFKQFFRGKRLYARLGLRKPPTPKAIINYELACCKWFVDETAAQAKAYRKCYPKMSFFEISLEELNQLDKARKMLEYFGINPGPSLEAVIGKATNLKRDNREESSTQAIGYYGD